MYTAIDLHEWTDIQNCGPNLRIWISVNSLFVCLVCELGYIFPQSHDMCRISFHSYLNFRIEKSGMSATKFPQSLRLSEKILAVFTTFLMSATHAISLCCLCFVCTILSKELGKEKARKHAVKNAPLFGFWVYKLFLIQQPLPIWNYVLNKYENENLQNSWTVLSFCVPVTRDKG